MAVVVLDASVLIGLLDGADAHHEAAVTAIRIHRADSLVLPASVYAEALVAPYRRGPEAVERVRHFVVDFGLHIQDLTPTIAERAAELRSGHLSLRLPDALVLATGDVLDAAAVLTADSRWRQISGRVETIAS